jgi:hypothetical protein
VYDRRVGGKELLFGNQGALYLNAMTWWDHETRSVWSQVTGEAIRSPLKGSRLRQIIAPVETWEAWRDEHPSTEVLDNGRGVPELLYPDFLIGVRLGEDVAAFAFRWVVERGVVNDQVGGVPIAIFARPDGAARVYSRTVGGKVLALAYGGGLLTDPVSGSAWDPLSGRALIGPVTQPLESLPWLTVFRWSRQNIYPESRVVG